MTRYINPNFRKASNLILVSTALALISFLMEGSFGSIEVIIVALSLTTLFVIALLIRKGLGWAKWVYTVIIALGVVAVIANVVTHVYTLGSLSYLSDAQLLIQIAAAVMLFIPTKQPLIDTLKEPDII